MSKNYMLYNMICIMYFVIPIYCSEKLDNKMYESLLERKNTVNLNKIAITSDMLGLGFPFNDVNRLSFNGFTYLIGKQINDLYQSGILNSDKRNEEISKLIEKNIENIKKLPIEGSVNYGALQYSEPDVELDKLLAAFIVSGIKGEITNIEPYLHFAKVYYGFDKEAMEFPISYDELSNIYNEKYGNLTKEQRLCFWPAANAILKNPEKTVPLLVDILKNNQKSDFLRMRAAGFLKEINKDLLKDLVDNMTAEEISVNLRKNLNCFLNMDVNWAGVDPMTDFCKIDNSSRNRIKEKRIHKN